MSPWTPPTINAARLRERFLDLVAFDSPPGEEREVSLFCQESLRDAGFATQRDAKGNLIAQKAGTVSEAPRIFFSAHVDTVRPTKGLVVREEDGVFRTSGDTILGADDKAAVAEILEAVHCLDESGMPHGDLQVVFSVSEEVGLAGAYALAPEVIAGGIGFVLDASGPTGAIITAAPTHAVLEMTFTGRAAHAGFSPENGVNAIRAAARAVAAMPIGRIDAETTANVGIIQGGTATNIVPDLAQVRAEARSRDPGKLARQLEQMQQCAQAGAEAEGALAEVTVREIYAGYRFAPDDLPLRIAATAWRLLGREPEFRPTGGGSDASVFNARGVPSVVLSCGYVHAHTFDEHVSLADLVAGTEWAIAIAHAATDPAVTGAR